MRSMEAESFHERRLRRLTLVATHQVLASEPLAAYLCDGCRDGVKGSHSSGCQLPLRTWGDNRRKAELWSHTYTFHGFNWHPVHWSDLEILRPRIVDLLLRYNWRIERIVVSVVFTSLCALSTFCPNLHQCRVR